MKHNLMLTITSLLSILFMTLHLTSDTVTPGLGRPRQGARPSLWCPSWSSGCTERWSSPNGGRGTSSCSNASAQFREDDGHSKVKVSCGLVPTNKRKLRDAVRCGLGPVRDHRICIFEH